jgi:hypothetical protein
MGSKIEITCFTDLKGSTALTEELGHHEFMPVLHEHLRLGKALASLNDGSYVKNIGDAHMVRFDCLESALAFASQLQQLSVQQPCYTARAISVRVSLFQGIVEPANGDVFGSGVNQAARLQGLTEPTQVTINDALFQSMLAIFGRSRAEKLCTSLGEHELKGIEGKQTIYKFEWTKYTETQSTVSVAIPLYEHLGRAGIDRSNLSASDLSRPGHVIWPVVPRDLATAIHRGQIELIRLLTMLGWQVTTLIADCGGEREYEDRYVESFIGHLIAHATRRSVHIPEVVRMSQLYEPTYDKYAQVQALFRRITSQMSVDILMALNTKRYTKDVQAEIAGKPTLTYLRPPLTLAAVLHLAESVGTKCVVVAGSDEERQWSQAYSVPNGRTRIGVLMIPVVNMDPEHQIYQGKQWPIWNSEAAVARHCTGSNVAWWLFRLLGFLPAFPERVVAIGDKSIDPDDWSDQQNTPAEVDVNTLVRHVWPILNPA